MFSHFKENRTLIESQTLSYLFLIYVEGDATFQEGK